MGGHAHACALSLGMRTTIELRNDQRARLLEIAARQGRKGFSHLIEEAVDRFLDEEEGRERELAKAIGALGALDSDEAETLRERTRALRRRWR